MCMLITFYNSPCFGLNNYTLGLTEYTIVHQTLDANDDFVHPKPSK